MLSKRLTLQQRKDIFMALVASQDQMNSVRQSYEAISEQFGISESQLKQIEEEGIDQEWPPLCEVMPT